MTLIIWWSVDSFFVTGKTSLTLCISFVCCFLKSLWHVTIVSNAWRNHLMLLLNIRTHVHMRSSLLWVSRIAMSQLSVVNLLSVYIDLPWERFTQNSHRLQDLLSISVLHKSFPDSSIAVTIILSRIYADRIPYLSRMAIMIFIGLIIIDCRIYSQYLFCINHSLIVES